MGVATILFAPAAHAATSEELKAMMGGLESELTDEALAKARNVAPKEGKPKPRPKAKKESSDGGGGLEFEAPDIGAGFADFGAAQREAGRKRAEAMRNRAFSPDRDREEMKAAPAAARRPWSRRCPRP